MSIDYSTWNGKKVKITKDGPGGSNEGTFFTPARPFGAIVGYVIFDGVEGWTARSSDQHVWPAHLGRGCWNVWEGEIELVEDAETKRLRDLDGKRVKIVAGGNEGQFGVYHAIPEREEGFRGYVSGVAYGWRGRFGDDTKPEHADVQCWYVKPEEVELDRQFVAGDRVQVNAPGINGHGLVGTVEEEQPAGYDTFVTLDGRGHPVAYRDHELELVKPDPTVVEHDHSTRRVNVDLIVEVPAEPRLLTREMVARAALVALYDSVATDSDADDPIIDWYANTDHL